MSSPPSSSSGDQDNIDLSDNDLSDLDTSDEAEPADQIVTTPIFNYDGDTEHPDDPVEGWEWVLGEDIAPPIENFSAYTGVVIPLAEKTPAAFFNLLFDAQMFSKIADETNSYAQRKNQGKSSYIFTLLFRIKHHRHPRLSVYMAILLLQLAAGLTWSLRLELR